MSPVAVFQSERFKRSVKKLHKNQKRDLDKAIRELMLDPLTGQQKTADLLGIRVYKFRMVGQLTLLAYTFEQEKLTLYLIAFGSHENFCRDLKH